MLTTAEFTAMVAGALVAFVVVVVCVGEAVSKWREAWYR